VNAHTPFKNPRKNLRFRALLHSIFASKSRFRVVFRLLAVAKVLVFAAILRPATKNLAQVGGGARRSVCEHNL